MSLLHLTRNKIQLEHIFIIKFLPLMYYFETIQNENQKKLIRTAAITVQNKHQSFEAEFTILFPIPIQYPASK